MNHRMTSLVLAASMGFLAGPLEGATCESLSNVVLPNGTITMAAEVPAGSFKLPSGPSDGFARLQSFCRVAVTLKPSVRSNIQMEVWLPSTGWNGRLIVLGNGSFAGTINYSGLANRLVEGYAMASTDTGHTGDASNTFINEDVLIDYSYRANHETTVAAKRFVDAYYGAPPKFTYFNGCSTGGRTGLIAAQRYPEDFDGIVAGAPNIQSSTQTFGQVWMSRALSSRVMPTSALQLVHNAVMGACDTLDGVKDGVLGNPRACSFDPGVLECREGQDPGSCLTSLQVEAVRKVYAGPSTPTGASIYPGMERGSELAWTGNLVSFALNYFRYLVFNDPAWDPKSLNFDTHVALTRTPRAQLLDVPADLAAFTSRGGRLILYHGWSDVSVPPRKTVSYYEDILANTTGAAELTRLFMSPGGGHCGGGDIFDPVQSLDAWVSQGRVPDRMDALRFTPNGLEPTRPVCAWPRVAHYKGGDNIHDPENFTCGPWVPAQP